MDSYDTRNIKSYHTEQTIYRKYGQYKPPPNSPATSTGHRTPVALHAVPKLCSTYGVFGEANALACRHDMDAVETLERRARTLDDLTTIVALPTFVAYAATYSTTHNIAKILLVFRC